MPFNARISKPFSSVAIHLIYSGLGDLGITTPQCAEIILLHNISEISLNNNALNRQQLPFFCPKQTHCQLERV